MTRSGIENVGDHQPNKTYLLTQDVGDKFQAFRYVRGGYEVPEAHDSFFTDIQKELAALIRNILKDDIVHVISMRDLSADILARAKKISDLINQECLIVSTCLEIAAPQAGQVLEVNRMVDFNGNFIGIGPRAGQMPLPHQIRSIIRVANNRPIIIVEDGSFTGITINRLVSIFDQEIKRLNTEANGQTKTIIQAIVLGFAFPDAFKKIKEVFRGELSIIDNYEDLDDWMPDHDFIPFTPNYGRALGLIANDNPYPFYNQEGSPFSIPYIFPYLTMEKFKEWTGFRDASTYDLCIFGQSCIEMAERIFRRINELNNTNLTLGDIRGCYPRSAIPFYLPRQQGETGFRVAPPDTLILNHNTAIIDLLAEAKGIIRMQIGYEKS